MTAPFITEAGLDARAQALAAGPGYLNRGVRESVAEARRQLAWGNDRFAARWASRAELLAGLITQDEYNARCDALQAAAAGQEGAS